jgi:type IV pilus assembly protein PilO
MASKMNQQQQMMVVASLIIVGGLYVYWTYLLKPTMDKIKTQQQTYQELVQKIETAERQARRLPVLQQELAKLQGDLSQMEKQLPKDKDLPNILRTLTREAVQEDLAFARLAPKPPQRQQYFEIIPFDVQFTGTLHSLARFLASLGQQDRIFQASNISLSPAGANTENSGVTNLNINLSIQTYAYAG